MKCLKILKYLAFIAKCTYSHANPSAVAESFQTHKKQQNTAFGASHLANFSTVDSLSEQLNNNLLKVRSGGEFDSKYFDKTTDLLKKKQISSLLTAKSNPSSSLKKSLLDRNFAGTSGSSENVVLSSASHGSLGSNLSGQEEKYGSMSKGNKFSTSFKSYDSPQTDGDGLYSMSSAHVSDEGRSFLHRISQNQRPGSFPSLSSSGLSSSSFSIHGPLQGYSQSFQHQEGQNFEGFYNKGGYPSLSFQSLHMASKSNNKSIKTSGTRNVDSESSDNLRFRFNSNSHNPSPGDDKRGFHTFGSKSSNDSNMFHSSLSYQLADKFTRRLFSPRLETRSVLECFDIQ